MISFIIFLYIWCGFWITSDCVKYESTYIKKKETNIKGLYEQVYPDKQKDYTEDWLEKDTVELRQLFGKRAKKKSWYKDVTSGMFLGSEIFSNINNMDEKCYLRQLLTNLSIWIDNG